MWRRKPYTVPLENGLYYLTTTLLERLPNSNTVKVTSMKTLPGIIPVSPKDDDGKKFVLGNENQDVYKTCFVRYERQDGKPVETRLDQLLEVLTKHFVTEMVFQQYRNVVYHFNNSFLSCLVQYTSDVQ